MDEQSRLIIRQTCVKAACELDYGINSSLNSAAILKNAEEFEKWILEV